MTVPKEEQRKSHQQQRERQRTLNLHRHTTRTNQQHRFSTSHMHTQSSHCIRWCFRYIDVHPFDVLSSLRQASFCWHPSPSCTCSRGRQLPPLLVVEVMSINLHGGLGIVWNHLRHQRNYPGPCLPYHLRLGKINPHRRQEVLHEEVNNENQPVQNLSFLLPNRCVVE